jgi:hypothetical protein
MSSASPASIKAGAATVSSEAVMDQTPGREVV